MITLVGKTNNQEDDYQYMVTIITDRKSSTTSRVFIQLFGSDGDSHPLMLKERDVPAFKSNSSYTFLVHVPQCVGTIKKVRIWLDYSGKNPFLNVRIVLIRDVQTDMQLVFPGVSLDILGDHSNLSRDLLPANTDDFHNFDLKFVELLINQFVENHNWISVFQCPRNSHFLRVERLSCCVSLVSLTMLTCVILMGIKKLEEVLNESFQIGRFYIDMNMVVVASLATSLMSVQSFILVSLFKLTSRRNYYYFRLIQGATENISEEDKENYDSCFDDANVNGGKNGFNVIYKRTSQCYAPNIDKSEEKREFYDIQNITEEGKTTSINANDKRYEFSQRSIKFSNFIDQYKQYPMEKSFSVGSEASLLDRQNSVLSDLPASQAEKSAPCFKRTISFQDESAKERIESTGIVTEHCKQGFLPDWTIYLIWPVTMFSTFGTPLYAIYLTLTWEREKSLKWLITLIVSLLQNFFILEPLKVIISTLVKSLIKRIGGISIDIQYKYETFLGNFLFNFFIILRDMTFNLN